MHEGQALSSGKLISWHLVVADLQTKLFPSTNIELKDIAKIESHRVYTLRDARENTQYTTKECYY